MAELAALAADMATEPAVGISRKILEWALDRDGGRAADDISVVALKIERKAAEQEIREMSVRYPL
jgi:hypothetical protein